MSVLRQLSDETPFPPDIEGASCLAGSSGLRQRDLEGAPERRQDLQRLAYLRRRLAGFEVHDKTQADARRARDLVLPQTGGFAGGPHDVANFRRCEVVSSHLIVASVQSTLYDLWRG